MLFTVLDPHLELEDMLLIALDPHLELENALFAALDPHVGLGNMLFAPLEPLWPAKTLLPDSLKTCYLLHLNHLDLPKLLKLKSNHC